MQYHKLPRTQYDPDEKAKLHFSIDTSPKLCIAGPSKPNQSEVKQGVEARSANVF